MKYIHIVFCAFYQIHYKIIIVCVGQLIGYIMWKREAFASYH